MKIVRSLDIDKWRQFVDEHPSGNIFHTPEMFQVFSRAKGHQPELWAATRDGRVLALLLPVKISVLDGLLRRFTTRAVVYGSVLCVPGPEGLRALAGLLHTYKRQLKGTPLFTELRNLADLIDLQPLLNEYDFAYEEHLNFLIDLDQPEEDIWRKISRSGRQRVRSSRNKGTLIEEVNDPQKLKIVYQLLRKVYTRAQVPLANPMLFEAAFNVLAPCGMFKVFLARIDEHYIGARLLLLYKGRIIDWYAGADRAFSSYSPNELLVWHTLQWGKEHDFHLFDFGGAGNPDEDYGPRRFKEKFGGTLVSFGRNICVHHPHILRFGEWGYNAYRRFL